MTAEQERKKMRATKSKAWKLGFKDGFAQPDDLISGITWEDRPELNEAYDCGAIAGQIAGALIKFRRLPLTSEPKDRK